MEEETPPPLDISRRFRTEKRVWRGGKGDLKHPRGAECAQSGSKTKAQRRRWLLKLS